MPRNDREAYFEGFAMHKQTYKPAPAPKTDWTLWIVLAFATVGGFAYLFYAILNALTLGFN